MTGTIQTGTICHYSKCSPELTCPQKYLASLLGKPCAHHPRCKLLAISSRDHPNLQQNGSGDLSKHFGDPTDTSHCFIFAGVFRHLERTWNWFLLMMIMWVLSGARHLAAQHNARHIRKAKPSFIVVRHGPNSWRETKIKRSFCDRATAQRR